MPTLSTIRLVALALLAAPGCIEPNLDHCGRKDGDRSCAQASTGTPYCSVCVAENDGCIAVEAAPACQVHGEASDPGSITGTTTTSSGSSSSTTTSESPTSSTTSESSTSATTTTTTTGEPPQSCGDGELDAGEQCDDEAFGDKTCEQLGFGGGELGCTESCEFDKSGCCLGENAECVLLGTPKCCPGLTCSLAGGLVSGTTCR